MPRVSAASLSRSYLTPPFAEATVADAMRRGLFSCPSATPVSALARIMATERVHAVIVTGAEGKDGWGIVTDQELLDATAGNLDAPAGEFVQDDPLVVKPAESLKAAAELLRRHRTSHVLVGDPKSGPPIGILSTLDVAAVVAWGWDSDR